MVEVGQHHKLEGAAVELIVELLAEVEFEQVCLGAFTVVVHACHHGIGYVAGIGVVGFKERELDVGGGQAQVYVVLVALPGIVVAFGSGVSRRLVGKHQHHAHMAGQLAAAVRRRFVGSG